MEGEYFNMKIINIMMENLNSEKKMDSAFLYGPMIGNLKGIGKTQNNMAEACFQIKMKINLDYGRMVKE